MQDTVLGGVHGHAVCLLGTRPSCFQMTFKFRTLLKNGQQNPETEVWFIFFASGTVEMVLGMRVSSLFARQRKYKESQVST